MARTKDRQIQVVVLMGGRGTRLGDSHLDTPKSMVDIYGRPFFWYQLQLMKYYGLRNFIFCVGYKAELIKSFFKDGCRFGVNIRYSFDGKELLGTGGALKKAEPFLEKDFMVIYADSYMDVDYREIVSVYYEVKKEQGKKALLTIFKNKNRYDKSNVIFKNNRLLKYDKINTSEEMEYIDYGISILDKGVLAGIPRNKYFDLSNLYSILVKDGLMAGYEVRNRFYEIGRPSSLKEFKKFIYQRAFVKKPAVILDRDGTLNALCLNEETGQLDSPLKPNDLKLLPKTIDALRIIKSLGYTIIVITNQPQAAKGKITLAKLYRINNELKDILAKNRIFMDDYLICPHHPLGSIYTKDQFLIKDCKCRKPKPGLFKIAREKFNLDIPNSYVVGDSYVDILAGKAVKMKTVFLGEYKCDACQLLKGHRPDYVFKNLYEFAIFLRKRKIT
ncbi:MAG: HAD-IIIA family hydrolase [Candidatus Omnitrophica bacterium]|nr:HAD-IIIA family hydrolase [Candidatus Omnitrophota bacterium]